MAGLVVSNIMPTQQVWDLKFLKIAAEFADLSNCISHKVGAVCTKNNRVIVTGYNGTPPGYINCCNYHSGRSIADHHSWSNIYEVHAEANIINFAAKHGIALDGCTLYCTLEPCCDCTKNLITAGIQRIVYSNDYRRMDPYRSKIEEFMKFCNVERVKLV